VGSVPGAEDCAQDEQAGEVVAAVDRPARDGAQRPELRRQGGHARQPQPEQCSSTDAVGDARDARRWAHRGRRIDAYHVKFALILGELEDDPAVGPPASAALDEALRAHPHYPDVRAALIRREFTDGQTVAARHRLQRWLDDQPEHPLALQLQEELAA